MKIKAYKIILDDGRDAYREIVPATSKKEALEWARGNGEVVSCAEYDCPISYEKVVDALLAANFGREECDVVGRILTSYYAGTI